MSLYSNQSNLRKDSNDDMTPAVILRARNDMPLVAKTLEALSSQTIPFRLVAFDNSSSDGTREEIAKYTDEIYDVPEGAYIPGGVINAAFEATDNDIVVFVNSDCTPASEKWLENLIAPLQSGSASAVFGRQIPRPDCLAIFARDAESAYGDGSLQARWRNCFSMASCAIRREVWQAFPFSTKVQYSEDIEWSYRVRRAGVEISYVANSVVMHSHNYTWSQFRKRHFGEGKAEAHIFEWSAWQRSLLRYSLLPFAKQVLGDARYCLARKDWSGALTAPYLRAAQLLGRRAGFTAGLKERSA